MVRRRCSVLSRGFRTAGARSRDRIRESEGLQGDRDLAMVGCQLTTLDVTRLSETSMFAIQQRAPQREGPARSPRYKTDSRRVVAHGGIGLKTHTNLGFPRGLTWRSLRKLYENGSLQGR